MTAYTLPPLIKFAMFFFVAYILFLIHEGNKPNPKDDDKNGPKAA